MRTLSCALYEGRDPFKTNQSLHLSHQSFNIETSDCSVLTLRMRVKISMHSFSFINVALIKHVIKLAAIYMSADL